ncbi:DUF2460 domain-containing protein [Massilia sp. W12]|uniref:DUF2460 domain-containing protein n=1 Tax=Massilia sp. W12 TaxID=3126507 RepID=UPI0030CE9A67
MPTPVFPDLPGIDWQTSFRPRFKTQIKTAASGQEFRAAVMANPLYNITLHAEFLSATSADRHWQTLLGFFNGRQGAFEAFNFWFDQDGAVIDQPLIVSADRRTAQLQRTLGVASEPVQNVKQIDALKLNGSAAPAWGVSETGLIAFNAPLPAGNLTWSGSYFYRCRFANDDAELDRLGANWWQCKKIELIGTLGRRI